MGGVDWINLAQDRDKWQSFGELNNETSGFCKECGSSWQGDTVLSFQEGLCLMDSVSFLLLLWWCYSPGWTLASFTICLQASRSLAVSLHSFIPIFLRSAGTSSSYLIFWSSSLSCCIQLSVQHLFWNCGVLHSFCVTKPSYSLAFNEPDNALPLNYSF